MRRGLIFPVSVFLMVCLVNSVRADITTGLAGHWEFEDGNGSVAVDSSGNGNNATLRNGPAWITLGRIGQSLYFDGINDYVLKTDPSWNFIGSPTNSFSVSAWFYPTTCVSLSGIALAAEGSWSGDLRLAATTNYWIIQLKPGTTHADGGFCSVNKWQHVTGVYNASETRLYIYYNGSLEDSKVLTNIDTSALNDRLNIGFAQEYFNGLIDDVRVYSRALSAGDVMEIYNSAGSAPPPDNEPPSTPASLDAATVSYDRINLSWTASSDNVLLIGYHVYRDGVNVANTTDTCYSDGGLSPSTTYTYTVSAYDFVGNEGSRSSPDSATTNAPDVTPPSTPANLVATAISHYQVNLTWTASTDDVEVTGYRVYRGSVRIGTSTATSYMDSTAAPSTTYTYTVSAYDGAGNEGSQSSPDSATTTEAPAGNIYYVSNTGCSDSGPGSQAEPWCTIQKAADSVYAADTVYVEEGVYDERARVGSGHSGSPWAMISFIANGNVKMQGFSVYGNYVRIKGFNITSVVPGWTTVAYGIFVQGDYCIIEDNYIYYCPNSGICTATISDGCVIRNNKLQRNTLAGMEIDGTNHLIENNEIWDTIVYHTPTNSTLTYDSNGAFYHGSGHVFRGNYIHDITFTNPETLGYHPHIDAFQTWAGVSNVLFEKNLIYMPEYVDEPGNSLAGWMLARATNITIRNNIVIIHRGTETGGGGCSNLSILNNVFVGSLGYSGGWPGGVMLENAPYSTVKNNIIYDQVNQVIYLYGTTLTGLDIGYNLAYNSDGSNVSAYTYTVQPSDLWNVNPMFMNPSGMDYHLQSGSPAIDNGTSVDLADDYDGNPRPLGAGYDIGAFEYSDCGPVEGDLNGDCSVTILDLAMIALDFGRRSGFDIRADTNNDNEIDIYDLVFVASRFS